MAHKSSGRGRSEFMGTANVPVIRVNKKRLVTMLKTSIDSSCRRLLREISESGCEIVAGIHCGGLGGGAFAADPLPHITVRVVGNTHHVHIDKFGRAFNVT